MGSVAAGISILVFLLAARDSRAQTLFEQERTTLEVKAYTAHKSTGMGQDEAAGDTVFVSAFHDRQLTLVNRQVEYRTAAGTGEEQDQAANTVDFGDDASPWARDGECDDPRFLGEGVAQTQLDSDTYHDATDCRSLFSIGDIRLRDAPAPVTVASHLVNGTARRRR